MQKKYFSIREVADLLKEPQSTLRFWEKEITLLKPSKSAGGTRRYTQKDIDLLRQIQYLINEQHLTLAGVNERLGKRGDDDASRIKVIETLKAVRKELMDIRHALNSVEAFQTEVIIDPTDDATEVEGKQID